MSHPSRTFQLIEARLGSSLTDHVRAMRHDGASWHAVTLDLAQRTGVAVTPETVRVWLAGEPDMQRRTAGAA